MDKSNMPVNEKAIARNKTSKMSTSKIVGFRPLASRS